MKNRRPFFFSVTLLLLFMGCSECNDCLDVQQKDLLVQDSSGNNLLFGDNAIFNPEEVTISTPGEVLQPLSIDTERQTLRFSLDEGETSYTLRLDDSTMETIVFELGERDSERCCGTQTFSTATQVNGATVDNVDTITIVK